MKENVKNSLVDWLARLQPEEVDVMLLRLNQQYDREAKKTESLKKETFWMNCKFWIIIFGIILILVAVLLLLLTTDVLI